MVYPAKITLAKIVETAHALIERDGSEQLSLGTLAESLGVKPPSLYRLIDSRAELVRGVNEDTFARLFAAFHAAIGNASGDADARLRAVFHAQRAFAHANPQTYMLAFSTSTPGQRGDENALVRMVLPIQQLMADLVGDAQALTALRGALALVHGFAMLELNNQLQRGGDLDVVFDASVAAFLAGWTKVP